MSEKKNNIINEAYETEKKVSVNLNKIVSFLNHFNKEYEVKYWDNLEGVDIIVKECSTYYQTISLNETGYLKFEKQESKDD